MNRCCNSPRPPFPSFPPLEPMNIIHAGEPEICCPAAPLAYITDADDTNVVAKFNTLLAEMKTAGMMNDAT